MPLFNAALLTITNIKNKYLLRNKWIKKLVWVWVCGGGGVDGRKKTNFAFAHAW